jgi:hypothetical protein
MKKTILAASLILFLILSGCSAGSDLGISFGGVRQESVTDDREPNYLDRIAPIAWPKSHKVITYQILGGGSHLPGINIPATADKALHRWDYILNPRGHELVEDKLAEPDAADITIEITNRQGFQRQEGTDKSTMGFTNLYYTKDGKNLAHARMFILRSLTPDDETQVVMHEMGHALGVRGHSPESTDLMYETIHLPAHITHGDANTVALIYER